MVLLTDEVAVRRKDVPAEIERAVLVEAGHRCGIPTCRSPTTEIAHIESWAKTQDNTFENLIALCPNCHTRADQKKEIDRKALKMYKQNLGILNNRYGEFERRLFEVLAETGERDFVLGAAGDLLVANAVKDGLFEDQRISSTSLRVTTHDGSFKSIPTTFVFRVTDAGVVFIENFVTGKDIA